jgi:hypothetical protein
VQEAGWSSSLPTQLPRVLRALAHEAADQGGRASPSDELEPSPPGVSIVVLASRATRVPDPADSQGPQRSISDSTTAVLTCLAARQQR